jgi:hyperosmotically inducible protein
MKHTAVRTDEDIKADIVEQLRWDSRVDASDITVEVSNGEVTLGGSVSAYSAHKAAIDDAWAVRGVTDVRVQIAIHYPAAGHIPADEEIRNNVKSTLSWNPDIDASVVEVAVDHGVVTLTGSVDAFWKKIRAEEATSHLRGITGFQNLLTVVPTRDADDEKIAEDIMAALDRNAAVEAGKINVKVKKGLVSLSGTVASPAIRLAARLAACHTNGVTEVTDNLRMARPGDSTGQ